jgi:opacity protein-like surface antigen
VRYLPLFFLYAVCLTGQTSKWFPVSPGVKLGAPINNPSEPFFGNTSSTTQSSRWTGGPTVELHLPLNLSLEFDALYRNSRTVTSGPFQFGTATNAYLTSGTRDTSAWDLPLLVKWRIPTGTSIRPFVSAGYQWTHQKVDASYFYTCSGPTGSCLPTEISGPGPTSGFLKYSNVKRGIAAGAGLEFRTKYVLISPEVRYNRNVESYPRENRFTALVGFTIGKRK